MLKIYIQICLLLLSVILVKAQSTTESRFLWQEVNQDISRMGVPDYAIKEYRLMQLDINNLKIALAAVPLEKDVTARHSAAIIELPLPGGNFGRFRVAESPVMADELAEKYPGIKTFIAQGIDDHTANARLDITHYGFHAQIRTANGTILIDPYNRETTEYYLVYDKKNAVPAYNFQCELDTASYPLLPDQEPEMRLTSLSTGPELRTYRLALACTGEYAQFHGGTKASVLSAMVTAMNRINGIYEAEVGIRMILIPNNDTLIFLSGSGDPYSNNNGSTMLGQNQTTIDNYIGTANYDIGHVFSTGGGGVAYLQSPCKSNNKARGVTGLPSPIGDPFYVDYVAHEMGHQWGGNHTFNGSAGSCSGGNRVASAAYEPGSATTIMGYAGICNNHNIQSNSDAYFHTKNFDEIISYSQYGTGNSCAVITLTGNNEPVLNAVPDFTIPYQTPFILTGSASDPDGDTLTYCWEQYDLGPAGHPNTPSGNAPIFRSFNPTTLPYRFFPRIQNIVNNNSTIGELLPSYARILNFRLTVRDNRVGGGGVTHNLVTHKVDVINTGIPFSVVSPNTNVIWYAGTQETILWDVAGTNSGLINTPFVDIILSLDGGYTYLDTLAWSVPNNGSAVITVPATLTTQARIMVRGTGNIFFDISNADFEIALGSGINNILYGEVEVYPNPAANQLNIVLSDEFIGATDITITDVSGRIVKKRNYFTTGKKEKIIMELDSVIPGLYFLKIENNKGTAIHKLIKQ